MSEQPTFFLDGAANFRDFGGYETEDGRRVRQGQLYRSNALAELTDQDFERLAMIGLRVVVDLRSEEERAHLPTVWRGEAPLFLTSAKIGVRAAMEELFASALDPNQLRQRLLDFYRQVPFDFADEYRLLFERLLAGDAPLLVHCSAGKDRTGCAAALVLTALGVPRETVIADYARTETILAEAKRRREAAKAGPDPAAAMFSHLPGEALRILMRSEPDFLNATFTALDEKFGSPDAYFEEVLGVGPRERETLRALYVE